MEQIVLSLHVIKEFDITYGSISIYQFLVVMIFYHGSWEVNT